MTQRVHDLDEPPAVPRMFHQLGILVLDGSGSMAEITVDKITKAEAVNMAVRELLGKLKASRVAPNFSLAVVTFDTAAVLHTDVTPMANMDDYGDYNPMLRHGGGTDIGAGLQQAQALAKQFMSQSGESVPRSVAVVVMSDGMNTTGDPLAVAGELKQDPQVTMCSTLFCAAGEDAAAAEDLLRQLATSPLHYRTTYRADDLRKFFIASVSSGKNVTIA